MPTTQDTAASIYVHIHGTIKVACLKKMSYKNWTKKSPRSRGLNPVRA